MHSDDLANRFTYHPPAPEQAQKYERIRELARDLATELSGLVPDSREKSLAITHLEQTVFWANAGIARNPA